MENAGINRSPSAYLFNPADERAKYENNTDTRMTLLKFVDDNSGKSIGAFNWFATHGTSMSKNNKLISGDNKGAAARFFEDWFTSNNSTRNTNFTRYYNSMSSKYVYDISILCSSNTGLTGHLKLFGGNREQTGANS